MFLPYRPNQVINSANHLAGFYVTWTLPGNELIFSVGHSSSWNLSQMFLFLGSTHLVANTFSKLTFSLCANTFSLDIGRCCNVTGYLILAKYLFHLVSYFCSAQLSSITFDDNTLLKQDTGNHTLILWHQQFKNITQKRKQLILYEEWNTKRRTNTLDSLTHKMKKLIREMKLKEFSMDLWVNKPVIYCDQILVDTSKHFASIMNWCYSLA